jgi:hypothetical protein
MDESSRHDQSNGYQMFLYQASSCTEDMGKTYLAQNETVQIEYAPLKTNLQLD